MKCQGRIHDSARSKEAVSFSLEQVAVACNIASQRFVVVSVTANLGIETLHAKDCQTQTSSTHCSYKLETQCEMPQDLNGKAHVIQPEAVDSPDRGDSSYLTTHYQLFQDSKLAAEQVRLTNRSPIKSTFLVPRLQSRRCSRRFWNHEMLPDTLILENTHQSR